MSMSISIIAASNSQLENLRHGPGSGFLGDSRIANERKFASGKERAASGEKVCVGGEYDSSRRMQLSVVEFGFGAGGSW